MPEKPSLPVRQFLLFASIGAVGTSGHFLTLILLVEGAALDAVWATTAGFTVGALINYALNYRFTFRSDKAHHEALSKFFIIAIIGAVINSLLMYLGVDVLGGHYLLVQVIASLTVLFWTFAGNKLWTFAEKAVEETA